MPMKPEEIVQSVASFKGRAMLKVWMLLCEHMVKLLFHSPTGLSYGLGRFNS